MDQQVVVFQSFSILYKAAFVPSSSLELDL